MKHLGVGVLLGALVLGGCGGGGDAGAPMFGDSEHSGGSSSGGSSGGSSSDGEGSPADPDDGGSPSGTAEGFFNGSTSNGFNFATVILEDGEFWGIYARGSAIYGVVHGNAQASGGAITGTGYDFYLPNGSRTTSQFSGSYSSKTRIAGTVLPQGTSFSGTYDKSYDVPANVADIVGTWRGNAVSEAGVQTASVTVGRNGGFVGSVSTCNYTGMVRPRASGKAVFDLWIRFASKGCLFNGQTLTGIAVVNTAGGRKALFTAALTQSGTDGFMAAASR